MGEKKRIRITRADVAREAGVTETIVSYVLNDNRYVDADKRKRVREAVKKLHYRPNTMARALKGKETNHILFIADDVQNEHFGKIISEMERIAYRKDYFISLCSSRTDSQFVNRVYERSFDGIIIGSVTLPESAIQELIDTGIPVVLLENRDYSHISGVCGRINTGLYEGERDCVRLLYEKGRKRLVFVDREDSDGNGVDPTEYRYCGFCDQIRESYGNEPIVLSGYKNERELKRLFEKEAETGNGFPDGICCFTDSVACTVMEIVKSMGMRIPEDVSIIGFNNSRVARFVFPRLSSVEIKRKEIGVNAMQLLERLMHTENAASLPLSVTLQTELVLRDSV